MQRLGPGPLVGVETRDVAGEPPRLALASQEPLGQGGGADGDGDALQEIILVPVGSELERVGDLPERSASGRRARALFGKRLLGVHDVARVLLRRPERVAEASSGEIQRVDHGEPVGASAWSTMSWTRTAPAASSTVR